MTARTHTPYHMLRRYTLGEPFVDTLRSTYKILRTV